MMYLWVALGSALGGVARHLIGLAGADLVGDAFQWATIVINASGSFVIGLFAVISGTDSPYLIRTKTRVFVMVGLCGGYTTFSAFSLQSFLLIREGHPFAAAGNVILSMLLCLFSVWLGYAAGNALIGTRRARVGRRRAG
jgi:fluoride exporter